MFAECLAFVWVLLMLILVKQKAAGSAAFCFIVKEQLSDVENHLRSYYIPILDGPSEHQGAHSQLTSLFINDPDGNLLEIAVEA